MYAKEIWVNSRLLGTEQMQRVFIEDPNKNLMVGEEGHDRFVSEASLYAIKAELRHIKQAFDTSEAQLARAMAELEESVELLKTLV